MNTLAYKLLIFFLILQLNINKNRRTAFLKLKYYSAGLFSMCLQLQVQKKKKSNNGKK